MRNVLEERGGKNDGLALSAGAWRLYKLGERLPDPTTIATVERMFPGTSDVLEYGPGCSYLWTALRTEPNAALEAIAREWRTGVVVRPTEVVSGRRVDYRVVPKAIAKKHALPGNRRGFPVVDVRKLLEPWQAIDEYLGRWVSINCPLPGRRALFLGPEPRPSVYPARFGAGNSNNATKLGIGERTAVTLVPAPNCTVTWSVSGGGTVSPTSGASTTFTAHDRASSPTITATMEGNYKSIVYNVVEPERICDQA